MDMTRLLRVQADRVAAVGCSLGGALVLLVGWIKVSSHAYPAEQLAYIASAGLGGMFLLGLGAVLWLSADLVDEWRKLDRLEAEMRRQTAAIMSLDATGASGRERSHGYDETRVASTSVEVPESARTASSGRSSR